MHEPLPEDDFEKRLSGLRLARHSGGFVSRGQALIRSAASAPAGWRDRLLPVLTLALVLSVTANAFQLARNNRLESLETEQLAQCQTPAVASSSAVGQGFAIATSDQGLKPLGMC